MAKFNVKLKNGDIVPMEAPDDWSTEQVQEAIHKHFPDESANESKTPESTETEPKERTGLLGVGADAAKMFGNALQSGKKFALDIPENLRKSGEDLEKHPLTGIGHIAGQLASGGAEAIKGAINSPHDLLKYMLKKHLAIDIPVNLPKINDVLGREHKPPAMISDLMPHVPEDTGVEKALGLEAQPEKGDALTRAIPDIAALGLGGYSGAKSLTKALKAPSKKNLFLREFEDKIAAAKESKDFSESEIKTLQDAHRELYSKLHGKRLGKASPTRQRESINVKQAEMKRLLPEAEIPEKHVGEIPPEPDTKLIVEKKKQAAESAREEAEKALGTLDHPRLKGSVPIKKAIEDVKQSSTDLYDSARKHYQDEHVVADNTAEMKSIAEELENLKNSDELAPGYGSGTEVQKSLEASLETLKGETVPAADMFDLQRTLETMAKNTRDKQYSGVSQLEFKRLGEVASNLQKHANYLEKRLESVGGKEVQSMMKEANKGWKIYKDLSERNPIGQGAIKGEIPARTMVELAKNHPSNEFLNALVESDPQLKKYILASHVGESSVNKLLKPVTMAKKYLQALPEVEEKLIAFKEALSGVKSGERQAASVKKAHDDLVKSMKEEAQNQQKRQSAIAKRESLSKQIKFHEGSIPKIEAKMKNYEAKSAEHAKLQKELDMHNRNLQDKNHRLKKLVNAALKWTGISSLGHKAGL